MTEEPRRLSSQDKRHLPIGSYNMKVLHARWHSSVRIWLVFFFFFNLNCQIHLVLVNEVNEGESYLVDLVIVNHAQGMIERVF